MKSCLIKVGSTSMSPPYSFSDPVTKSCCRNGG